MNPWEVFNKIYYINLDSRQDRKEALLKEFESVNLTEYTRVPGIIYKGFNDKHRNSCFGNALAHSFCIRDAKKLGLDNCLIFEDDVDFFPNAFENLTQSILELSDDWDMFYLGGNMDRFNAYQASDHIAKLEGCFATHAYAVRHTMFNKLIEINENKNSLHNDVAYADIMSKHNVYITIPLVAGQKDDYSDIMGQTMSSNEMFLQRFKDKLIRL